VIGQLRRAGSFKHGRTNLKGAEKHILLLIGEMKKGQPVTISEIANKIGVTLAAVTHQINALEQEGLIERLQDKEDRRLVFIALSKKGQVQVVKLKKEFSDRIKKLTDFLGEKDTLSLIHIVKRISDYPEFNR
jgi:DNA-binding MarR family transcriptional regulator